MASFILGRGDSPLNSITVSKEITENIIEVYECNFTNIPVSVNENSQNTITDFKLDQNYPNPFNPSTIISYSVPEKSFVQLKVYNILGEEIANLVNGLKEMGSYNINFNGVHLPSGVYIYSLMANNFQMSKKNDFNQVMCFY